MPFKDNALSDLDVCYVAATRRATTRWRLGRRELASKSRSSEGRYLHLLSLISIPSLTLFTLQVDNVDADFLNLDDHQPG